MPVAGVATVKNRKSQAIGQGICVQRSKAFRYSGIGIFFSSGLTFIQGCTQSDSLDLLLLLLLLLLTGGSADLTVDGTGSGTIVGSNNNINCTLSSGSASGTCTDSVRLGSTQTLTATPASGFDFDNWSNCTNPSGNTCEHAMVSDTTITANFIQTFTLQIQTNFGRVTGDIGGINCLRTTCTYTFPANTVVTLTAIEDGSGGFDSWVINAIPSVLNPVTITINADTTVVANFQI